ncbi:AraC family transcriptional regulator [Alkalimarinus alittae]|uniref:AraC family transcriptional regulator n=1 Tax=Alkalimarinus alittae TaxID=2961619 RepID=A0ABY6N2F2_9ALTE|nr:AraC family transcriptional regulator [Alkalimarinus alittae]UZE96290.1 AraC family transcriptional regulator [Alkalimarinus alittae]
MSHRKLNRKAACSATVNARGDVRIGAIQALPDVLAEQGCNPEQVFAQVGLDLSLFDDAENRAQIDVLGHLLAECVAQTGCEHFGLLVAGRFDLSGFGMLGDLLRNAPTLGGAMRSLVQFFHLEDRAAAPLLLTPWPDEVLLGYSIFSHSTPATDQIEEVSIAIAYRMLAELYGPGCKVSKVTFSCRRPRDIAPYRRFFQSGVSFDADVCGIVFPEHWLEKTVQGANATRYESIVRAFQREANLAPMTLADKTECILPQLILSGNASTAAITQLLAIQERTLRRKLSKEGKNLRQLINNSRSEIAKKLLHNTELSVTAIALSLHYDDPNVFSRAFHNWEGICPTEWRAQQRNHVD